MPCSTIQYHASTGHPVVRQQPSIPQLSISYSQSTLFKTMYITQCKCSWEVPKEISVVPLNRWNRKHIEFGDYTITHTSRFTQGANVNWALSMWFYGGSLCAANQALYVVQVNSRLSCRSSLHQEAAARNSNVSPLGLGLPMTNHWVPPCRSQNYQAASDGGWEWDDYIANSVDHMVLQVLTTR